MAVARAVLAVDAEAATRRREEAQKDPRVRRWQEDAGTAALAGFGLPPADVLEADQRLTTRALALREAGLPGSLEELRARAYLDTLLGQDSAPAPAQDEPAAPDEPGVPAPVAPAVRGRAASPAVAGHPLLARVTLTVPLATYLGTGCEPGTVTGFGPVDPVLARDLVTRAAAHPASRFCLTVTGPAGAAIGHGCFPGRPSSFSSRSPTQPDRPPNHSGRSPNPPDLTQPTPDGCTVIITPLAGSPCAHQHEEPVYRPSRRLRHLVEARLPTCTAPGCSRSAARCDLDHTTPYADGGRTCECNLGPLCRHHHRCKQSGGWRLDQPSPGVMQWTTPAGRRYLTTPS